MPRTVIPLLLLLATACGNISRKSDDGGLPPRDAARDAADAAVNDAPVDAAVGQSREIVSGAVHMASATYQMDVEIGQPVGQGPVSGPTYTLEGNASVKP